MRLLIFISIFCFASINAHAYLSDSSVNESCQEVKVDCTTHKLQIDNEEEVTIDCGAGGSTPTTKGRVGGPHNGQIVKDGVDIVAPGMGQDGGGKVFHTWEAGGKATDTEPTGSDTTQGCVAVNLKTLNKLKTCKNASLEIKGNGPGNHIAGNGSGGARAPARVQTAGRGAAVQ